MNAGPSSRFPRLRRAAYWFGVWFVMTAAFMAFGMLVGALLWVVIYSAIGDARTVPERFKAGLDIGMQFTRVWAGGLAIVLCFIKAHENFSFRDWCRRKFSGRP